jgi:hypothetical protein
MLMMPAVVRSRTARADQDDERKKGDWPATHDEEDTAGRLTRLIL